MLQIQRFNKVLKTSVIIGDLVILNVLFISLYSIWNEVIGQSIRIGALPQTLSLFNLCYFACAAYGGVVLHHRGSRADQVMLRVLRNMFFFILLTMSVYSFAGYGDEIPIRFFISFFIVLAIALISFRLFFHSCIQAYRSRGGNTRLVVLLGSAENVMELFREMTADRSTGYRVVGYFDSYPNFKFSEKCPYLGTPDEVKEYLEAKHIEQVYCCWPRP